MEKGEKVTKKPVTKSVSKRSRIANQIAQAVNTNAQKEIRSKTDKYEKLAREKEAQEKELRKVEQSNVKEELGIKKDMDVVGVLEGEVRILKSGHFSTLHTCDFPGSQDGREAEPGHGGHQGAGGRAPQAEGQGGQHQGGEGGEVSCVY